MRNLNECKAEIFSRIEKGIKARNKKRKCVLAVLIPTFVCTATVLSLVVLKGDLFTKSPKTEADDISIIYITSTVTSNTPQSNDTTAPKDDNAPTVNPPLSSEGNFGVSGEGIPEPDSTSPSDTTKDDPPPSPLGSSDGKVTQIYELKANKITSTAQGAKLYFDPALHTEKTLTDKEATDYLGVDLSKLNVNDKNCRFVSKNLITNQSGEVVYDTFVIHQNDNITILASKISMPYDCIYTLDNTVESIFYYPENKTLPQTTAIIGTDDNGFYYADFSAGGINYRVTMTECSNFEEFGLFVKSIIDLSIY